MGSYNDGGKISLSSLRGSAAIEQLSHNVIAIEGDQSEAPNIRTARVLKNREWGDIGVADTMRYDSSTGRLRSVEEDSEVKF
jgi:twinkle protein